MRIHTVCLFIIGIAVASHAGDFYLKDQAGKETGPFAFREGAKVSVGDREATISVRRGQIEKKEDWGRLDRIKLPEIEFRDACVADVVTALQKASVQYDTDKRGVNMILNLAGAESPPTNSTLPRVTFRAQDISLTEAVKVFASIAALKCRFENDRLFFLPWNAADGPIVTRRFDVLPNVSEKISNIAGEFENSGSVPKRPDVTAGQDADLQAFFKELGVSWPIGSSIKYVPVMGKLAVANTVENLELLEGLLSALGMSPNQIEMELQFVAFKLSDLSKIAEGGIRRSELDELRARGAGRLIAAPKMTTQSGVQATVKGATELTFPGEPMAKGTAGTNLNSRCPVNAAEEGLESREVGVIFTAIAEVSPVGQMINVTLTPELVADESIGKAPGRTSLTDEGITNGVPREMPAFHKCSANTTVSVSNGETVLVGGGMPTRDGQESVYCYLTVHLVDPKGNDLPRP